MEEEQRLVWKLKVGVRSTSFNLKLNLENRISSWKLHRLSFLFRFRKHLLKIDSGSKSKFRFRFLRRLLLFKFLRRRKRREGQFDIDRWVDSKTFIGCKDKLDETVGNRFSKKALVFLGLVSLIITILALIIIIMGL